MMSFEEAIKIGKTRQECLRAQNDGRCKYNIIPNYCIKGCKYNTSNEEYDEFETLAIKVLEQLLHNDIVSKEKTGWIPVSEDLPKLYEEVIVTDIETIDTYVSRYVGNGYWECDNGLYQNRIIAWQPKPKPYKTESDDKDIPLLKEKTGEWLRMSDLSEQEDDRYKCSYCGNVVHYRDRMNLYTFNSWCGRCGSNNGRQSEVSE